MARRLTAFTIAGGGEEYVLRLEAEDGEPIELSATYDQLDLISETIDQKLNEDEEDALEVAQDD